MAMKKFHDVEIYSGTRLATTASRLEIGVKSKFLLEIFSGLADCDRCKEPLVLIFPEEEESTLREVFNRLSHFKSGFSIVENPVRVNSLLERLTHTAPQEQEMSRQSSGGRDVAEPGSYLRIVNVETCSEDTAGRSLDEDVNENISSPPFDGGQVSVVQQGQEKRTERQEKVEVGSSKKKVSECYICHSRLRSRSKLYAHYARVHFRSEIENEFGKNEKKCRLCKAIFSHPQFLIDHLGNVHNKVDEFLPKIHHISKNRQGFFSNMVTSEETTQLEQTDDHSQTSNVEEMDTEDGTAEKDLEEDVNVEATKDTPKRVNPNRKYLECHICHLSRKDRTNLYRHYALQHFRREIKEYIGENTLECRICRKTISTQENLIAHIGSVHRKVEDFLPEAYRITVSRQAEKDTPEETTETMNPDNTEREKSTVKVKDRKSTEKIKDIRSVFDDSDDSDN